MYQKDLTRKNIIDNNIYNIYGVYSATAIASMLFTNNPISLLQNFILITAIQVFAFKVNLDYFTSNTYKNKLNKRIKQIDESKDIDNYHVKVLYRFRDMCIDVLKIQVAKLYELMDGTQNGINKNDLKKNIAEVLRLLSQNEKEDMIDIIAEEQAKEIIELLGSNEDSLTPEDFMNIMTSNTEMPENLQDIL